jgi:hypothetical protein
LKRNGRKGTPPPPLRLKTALDIQAGLERLFNGLMDGSLDAVKVGRGAYILSIMLRSVELCDQERRIGAIERMLGPSFMGSDGGQS